MLKIDQDALFKKWTALTGRQPRRDLKFEPVADCRTPEAAYLQRLVMFVVDQLGSSESIPPLALAELEQSIIVAFLCANRHNESRLLDGEAMGTAPWQVRRAEEYIEGSLGPADHRRGARTRDRSERAQQVRLPPCATHADDARQDHLGHERRL
jgi:hypothetical protein